MPTNWVAGGNLQEAIQGIGGYTNWRVGPVLACNGVRSLGLGLDPRKHRVLFMKPNLNVLECYTVFAENRGPKIRITIALRWLCGSGDCHQLFGFGGLSLH